MAKKQYRVLSRRFIPPHQCEPDDVMSMDEKDAKPYVEDGTFDGDKAAVDYCLSELGKKAIEFSSGTKSAQPSSAKAKETD